VGLGATEGAGAEEDAGEADGAGDGSAEVEPAGAAAEAAVAPGARAAGEAGEGAGEALSRTPQPASSSTLDKASTAPAVPLRIRVLRRTSGGRHSGVRRHQAHRFEAFR